MSKLFYGDATCNGDISNWNTSNVTTMKEMFASIYFSRPRRVVVFNKDISCWDVSSVTDMSYMFYYNTVFDQNISGWSISSGTTMKSMFEGAYTFDQNISSWDLVIKIYQIGLFV